jgi:hypothetical protein
MINGATSTNSGTAGLQVNLVLNVITTLHPSFPAGGCPGTSPTTQMCITMLLLLQVALGVSLLHLLPVSRCHWQCQAEVEEASR